jgi:hypothetical protein
MKKKRLLQNLREMHGGLPTGLSKSFKVEKEEESKALSL